MSEDNKNIDSRLKPPSSILLHYGYLALLFTIGLLSIIFCFVKTSNDLKCDAILQVSEKDTLVQIFIPQEWAPKIKTGQTVHLNLNNFPQQQFGYLKAAIIAIPPEPARNRLQVLQARLLHSNIQQLLPLSHIETGKATLVLGKSSLLNKYFNLQKF